MLTIILTTIIGAISLGITTLNYRLREPLPSWDTRQPVAAFLGGAMWGAMFSLVVGLIMAGIITAKYPGTIEIVYHDTPILALQDNTSISGGGLIFVTISSSPEYVFYEKNTDGSIEQKRINVRGVKIFESEDDQPFVRRTEEQTKAASPWCLSIGPVFKTEFHVPKGTVIQEYRLDAK